MKSRPINFGRAEPVLCGRRYRTSSTVLFGRVIHVSDDSASDDHALGLIAGFTSPTITLRSNAPESSTGHSSAGAPQPGPAAHRRKAPDRPVAARRPAAAHRPAAV